MIDRIIGIFKQSQSVQNDSEALLKLATFFYKIDGRIALAEQDYVSQLVAVLDWDKSISASSFQQSIIPVVQNVIDSGEEPRLRFLEELMGSLSQPEGVELAKKIAQEISDADGEVADNEVKYLHFVDTY